VGLFPPPANITPLKYIILRHGTLSSLCPSTEILSCWTQFDTQSEHYFSNTETESNIQLQKDSNLPIYYTVQGLSWKTGSCLAGQEIPKFLRAIWIHSIYLTSILILSPHLHLGLPLPFMFPTKITSTPLISLCALHIQPCLFEKHHLLGCGVLSSRHLLMFLKNVRKNLPHYMMSHSRRPHFYSHHSENFKSHILFSFILAPF
jgi:hypothetical protein